MKTGQKKLTTEVADLKTGQTKLITEIGGLKEGQVKLTSGVKDLKSGQGRIEDKVDHLSLEMRSHFHFVEGKLNIHANVIEIADDENKNVQIEIDYLKAKTRKHEAEIHKIKKKLQSK
ncbi:hypothetical protein BFG57_12540 [Bacillus solimangrovi]|uniref:Uncharacterized protein n=1 Tax=Bacillus solimangrovi TaxID=1305675 RepID=A0A1E5LH02_9BACI|nr:hypothetical protein BFG57_12540 [Bacillus solimangrovi]